MAQTRLQKLRKDREEDIIEVLDDEHDPQVQEVSLDQLFKDLVAETSASKAARTPEEPAAHLATLPKIQSRLDSVEEPSKPVSKLIVRVNDPIPLDVDKRKRTKVEETDSGSKWFNMKTQELTPEVKRDLMILKNRSALDPKRHYKKDNWEIPKFFQMGTIVEGNTEFYSSRMSKKSRGKTIAEQILKDDQATEYFDKKHKEIQAARTSGGKAHYQRLMRKRRGF